MKLTRALPGFEGVAVGQTATVRLPIGFTYEKLLIDYGSTAAGNILTLFTGMRLMANGKPIMDFGSFADLDARNQFDGMKAAATAAGGILTVDLMRYGMRTRAGEEYTRIGTGDPKDKQPISTLDLEIDIAAGATAPTLSGKAVRVAPEPSGNIIKLRKFTKNAGVAGILEISDLPRGPDINRIFFAGHTANVYNSLTIERDGAILFERTTAENEEQQNNGVRVPQADLWVFDPSESGLAEEMLVTAGVQDLRFKLDVTNPGAVPIWVEYIDVVGN